MAATIKPGDTLRIEAVVTHVREDGSVIAVSNELGQILNLSAQSAAKTLSQPALLSANDEAEVYHRPLLPPEMD